MLDRLSQRLNSVAALSASSQSKEVAYGRALNPQDIEWVGASSALAEFTDFLAALESLKRLGELFGEAGVCRDL